MSSMTTWYPSMAMKVFVDLGAVEIMEREGGYMSPAEIAAQLPTTNAEAAAMLGRLMRLLASYEKLTWRMRTTEDGRVEITYGVVGVGQRVEMDKDDVDASAKDDFVPDDFWENTLKKCWFHMKNVILEGGVPFNKTYGMNFFEYLKVDPIVNNAFNNTMSYFSSMVMKQLLENYDGFKCISTLVDVGGGIGTALNMIISKYPSINGINFDLPEVIKMAPSYPGVQHVSGDMFVSVPTGDAIFLKWICHDWSDERCVQILSNIYEALPSNGKVIICDCILPATPETSTAAKLVFHMDLSMLTLLPGAKERTEADFEYLAKASGFQGFKVVCSACHLMVMEFLKTI